MRTKRIVINRLRLNYYVSEDGKVTNESGLELKPYLNKDGYLAFTLPHRKAKIKVKIHRVVAKAFLPRNKKGKPFVNHKDGNKLNNHYHNLEWTTVSENTKHAYDAGLSKYTPPVDGMFTKVSVIGYSEEDPVGFWFPSMASLKKYRYCARSVRRVINNQQNTHRGLIWERISNENTRDS